MTEPLLRTLAPLLRLLQDELRAWLVAPHRKPPSIVDRARLEGLSVDLTRSAEALDVDKPLLVVLFMGGTGVGKSSLLNALAGAPVAQASFTRPTTRDPVVYHHQSIRTDRLDPALRRCKLVPHDREALAQKILIDTPDLDSNDLANRDRLIALLPIADIVLYVGSQEKYHDAIGWEIFQAQRKRRAFAFVLNKWDRCATGETGVRPDEDLLRDLKKEGFENPRLFRTCAQAWIDSPTPTNLPAGEQFQELVEWLELGLTRNEIEAVKSRGVGRLLGELDGALATATPPDLSREAERVRDAWDRTLREESAQAGDVLLQTLEPFAADIEQHFRTRLAAKFRGLMATYWNITTRFKIGGSLLKDRFGLTSKPSSDSGTKWDIDLFARTLTRAAGERILAERLAALGDCLLVQSDAMGLAANLVREPVMHAARSDWQERYDRAIVTALRESEVQFTEPTGPRRWLHAGLTGAANLLPELTLLFTFLRLLYRYFMEGYFPSMFDLLLPFGLTLAVLVVLQTALTFTLPVRWARVRGTFHHRLIDRLHAELAQLYGPIPHDAAEALRAEREQVAGIRTRTAETLTWLTERAQATAVAGLYAES